jgi:hypothetical protein
MPPSTIRRVTIGDYNNIKEDKSLLHIVNTNKLSIELCVLSVLSETEKGELLGYISIADRFGKSFTDPTPYDSLLADVQECVVDAVVSVSFKSFRLI